MQRLPHLGLGPLEFAVLRVHVPAHPVAVGQLGAQVQPSVQLGRLGQGGVRLREAALGQQGAGHRPVHARHQRRVAGLRGQRQRELRGLRGPCVRAHVHVRADDAGVQQEQRVRVVQAAPVQLVDGALQQVHRVPQFPREVVRDGPAAHRRHPRGQRGVGEPRLRLLEVAPPVGEFTRVQRALAEPEQRGGLLLRQLLRLRLGQQRRVLLHRRLRLPDGEGALRLGQPQPQFGDPARGTPGRQFVELDSEPLREMPQRLVGRAHPAGLQGGDVGGGVHRLRQLFLCQPARHAQPLHTPPDRARLVPLPHANSPSAPCRSRRTAPRLNRELNSLNPSLLRGRRAATHPPHRALRPRLHRGSRRGRGAGPGGERGPGQGREPGRRPRDPTAPVEVEAAER